jgi:hypothetical protein
MLMVAFGISRVEPLGSEFVVIKIILIGVHRGGGDTFVVGGRWAL